MSNFAKTLIILGCVFIIMGIIILVMDKLSLSRLPGDISIKRGKVSFYFPIGTCLLLSALLTLFLKIFNK